MLNNNENEKKKKERRKGRNRDIIHSSILSFIHSFMLRKDGERNVKPNNETREFTTFVCLPCFFASLLALVPFLRTKLIGSLLKKATRRDLVDSSQASVFHFFVLFACLLACLLAVVACFLPCPPVAPGCWSRCCRRQSEPFC